VAFTSVASRLSRKAFFISGAVILAPLLVVVVLSVLFPLPPLKPYSLTVEDRDGRLLQAFLSTDGQWRLRTDPSEIPERLRTILIQREDRWFKYHPGVNPLSLARAAWQNLRSGRRVSGGSTITMQIARMLEPKRRTVAGKLVEVFRALQLEARYSKRELLEMYLSMVPLGGNIEGLKSASLLYYQTPPERLNIARLLDLILIPRDPNNLQPDRNPDRLYAERCRSASRWMRRGFLTRQDSLIIWETPAVVTRMALPREAPHFCQRVRELKRSGGDVRTTLSLSTQHTVERLVVSHMQTWKTRGVANCAVLVVENATRRIVAYAGSADFGDAAGGQVDAVRALRSPGSTLKPFLFAMLMDGGSLTPKSRLLDVPYDAEGFSADNYDGSYSGLVYADDALRRSLNVPMVRLLKTAGTSTFVQFAEHAGLRSLRAQESRLGLSMILGGCGVSLEELVGAYAAFPNGGALRPLRSFEDEIKAGDSDTTAMCSSSAAFMITSILSGMNRPDLPNGFESSVSLPAVAFKTGTSYGRRDAWAIGYTASHTVGVWMGNNDNVGSPELVGGRAAAPLLFDVLNVVTTDRRKTILAPPPDIAVRQVCTESGLDPTVRCAHQVEDVYSILRTERSVCSACKELMVSPDGNTSYCVACVGEHPFRTVTAVDYPPDLLNFWKRSNVPHSVPSAHFAGCTNVPAGAGPSIVSPSDEMTYYLANQSQQLSLQAAALSDVSMLAWYVDDRFLGRRSAGVPWLITIGEGRHVVSVVDDHGRASSSHFTVKLSG
jgi:penicillin-binding protein 1C